VIYSLLRSAAAVALRWYYADVTIVGSERVPTEGPILVVVNHPNALVDVLVTGKAVPRRLMFTAKATLFSNPVAAWLLRTVGVLPLRRASDEAAQGKTADLARNAQSFDAVADALAQSAAILIFPEGKSHDEPAMAPARTGAARMILHARDTRQVAGVQVVPIGLIFERKDRPRSRIVAIVDDPIDVDPLVAANANAVTDLTAAIDAALRGVTLNYSTIEAADRDARLARALHALLRFDAPSVASRGGFRGRTEIARLLPALRRALAEEHATINARARNFEIDLLEFDARLRQARVSLDDFSISRGLAAGAAFVVREALVLVLAGPIALWGWINHVIPFRAALLAGGRVKHSAADPAMRTIVAGAAFVLMMYMLQAATVAIVAGPWWGLAYLASLPVAADINLRMRDRLHRALRRARTYLSFRAQPKLQDELTGQARRLRDEAVALAHATGFANVS
jgi:glycerol-3-phosphate O-acyltransferase/dihydroxyacetone phosphate acyltransferase